MMDLHASRHDVSGIRSAWAVLLMWMGLGLLGCWSGEFCYDDLDGDGWAPEGASQLREGQLEGAGVHLVGDCDDGDVSVNPEAPEICNGVDDDCDGLVDEGLLSSWYLDADGDGWGEDV